MTPISPLIIFTSCFSFTGQCNHGVLQLGDFEFRDLTVLFSVPQQVLYRRPSVPDLPTVKRHVTKSECLTVPHNFFAETIKCSRM